MSKYFKILHDVYLKNYSFKKSSSLFFLFLLSGLFSQAQNNLKIVVKSKNNQQPLPGASVIISQLNKGVKTDSSGFALIEAIPNGTFQIEVSFVGYTTTQKTVTLPSTNSVEVF